MEYTTKQIREVIKAIEREMREYVEESEYTDRFRAKVLDVFKLVLFNEEIELIAEKAFTNDIIDTYVNEFESS